MKRLLKYIPFIFLSIGLSSCLDEDDPLTNRDTESTGATIQFAGTPDFYSSQDQIHPVYIAKSFEAGPTADLEIEIGYLGTGKAAPEDITVTVAPDPAALEAYNDKVIAVARQAAIDLGEDPDEAEEAVAGDLFDLFSSDLYTMASNQVIIKKGEKSGILTIQVKPNAFDFNKRYGLPLSITTATAATVSGNFGTAIFNLTAKNQYDGIYSIEAGSTIIRNSAAGPDPALSGSTAGKADRELVTLGGNTVGLVPIWANGSTVGGIDNTYLTIDPATNLVTVASRNNPGLKNTSGKENRYDPATKTFYLAFDWGSGANTRVATFVLKYKGPR